MKIQGVSQLPIKSLKYKILMKTPSAVLEFLCIQTDWAILTVAVLVPRMDNLEYTALNIFKEN